jgi:hypothetical protein
MPSRQGRVLLLLTRYELNAALKLSRIYNNSCSQPNG